MGKKQFDYIENRIKEAAENSEPSFDESAWAKMELRLDEENNKKRRFLLWWFLLPLLFIGAGGGTYFLLNNKTSQRKTSQHVNQNITADKTLQQKDIPPVTSSINGDVDVTKKNNDNTKSKKVSSQTTMQLFSSKNDIATGAVTSNSDKISGLKKGKVSSKINPGQVDDNNATSANIDSANINVDIASTDKKTGIADAVNPGDTMIKKDSSKNIVTQNLPESNNDNKAKKENISNFYFIASIGAEVTGVKLFSFHDNPISAKYGIGIGYQLNKKVSIQTGFYAGMKKYIAGPEDYNPTYKRISGDTLVKVDASCLVYDIPVTIRYNFVQKSTTVFYATAGLSSFIMKKEDYNFYLIDTSNASYQKSIPYTGNSNFFSVFNISAGIEKKLSPNFSILAEPSISIPITGVGWGRVKLYSAALQVGIKYNPHRKHK